MHHFHPSNKGAMMLDVISPILGKSISCFDPISTTNFDLGNTLGSFLPPLGGMTGLLPMSQQGHNDLGLGNISVSSDEMGKLLKTHLT